MTSLRIDTPLSGGRYTIKGRIGQGDMGEVFLARDRPTWRSMSSSNFRSGSSIRTTTITSSNGSRARSARSSGSATRTWSR